ncbi:hypothetical protein L6164_033408 [Bauhinia variegata]|uniref:Uncharacterized protein n=1 Tax=Bauhinia variegata TaxID=167791 RepID=A0ACB9KS08_BAUVA|nr:hypothetical protein L6164_033408 [Bauhinia variegata]
MNQVHAFTLPPGLLPSPPTSPRPPEDTGLEGISTHLKVLLKIIQDYNGGSTKYNDEKKSNKVAGMISIIDDVRTRIQKVQSSTRRRAELRRCNTDLKSNIPSPREKKSADHLITDEKERLRRELSASLIARKSLQAMCSSLGKEKEIMARELARKAQQLTEMEEFISDLKARNEMLLEKLHACNIKQKEQEERNKSSNGGEMQGNMALQERNEELSKQLQKSLDGHRILKRRLKETQEENRENEAVMQEMEYEIQAGSDRLNGLKDKRITNEETNNITTEILVLEDMLESLQLKISKIRQKKSKSLTIARKG